MRCRHFTCAGLAASLLHLPRPFRSPHVQMKGCEAYNALCSNTTAVEQCLSPGPVPDAVTTFTVRDGIEVRTRFVQAPCRPRVRPVSPAAQLVRAGFPSCVSQTSADPAPVSCGHPPPTGAPALTFFLLVLPCPAGHLRHALHAGLRSVRRLRQLAHLHGAAHGAGSHVLRCVPLYGCSDSITAAAPWRPAQRCAFPAGPP